MPFCLDKPRTASVAPVSDTVKKAARKFTADGDHKKILIIGGGSSGLFAAYTLQYLGITNYEILEARADFGGRVQEVDNFSDVKLDLGAEWIHVQPRILQDLLLYDPDKKSVAENVKTIVYHPKTFGVYSRKKLRRRNWLR